MGHSKSSLKWRFFKKLKAELPQDAEITLLGIHPKKMKTLIRKDSNTYTPINVDSIIYSCQDMEAT